MTRIENRGILSRTTLSLLVSGGILALAAVPYLAKAQEKKAEAKPQEKKPEAKVEKKAEAKPQEKKPEAKVEKKAEAKPQEKKAEAKPAATPAPAPAPAADDPAKLKAQVAALQQEVAQLKL